MELEVTLPNVDQETAQQLTAKAPEVCPCSNAIRGNIAVTFVVADD